MKYYPVLIMTFLVVVVSGTSPKTFGDISHDLSITQNHLIKVSEPGDQNTDQEQKERRIKVTFFNDNFGSNGNEFGLTHGSRIRYSEGPADGENFSIFLESQLYLADYFWIREKGKTARVQVVEQNNIELTKQIPLSHSEYVILGVLTGWTTNRSRHFMLGGAKYQQELFHDSFNGWSEDIKDYEYNQDWCYFVLNQDYKYGNELIAWAENEVREGCSVGNPGTLNHLKSRGFDCEHISDYIGTITADFEGQIESALKGCKGKTKAHVGVKVAFGKIYRLDEIRNICKKPKSDLSCITYFQVEGGMDLITVTNDSAVYFSTEINQPLFSFRKNSTLSASARLGFRHRTFKGKLERHHSLGFQWFFQNSNLRLEMVQPHNSSGRLFDILNDDDSIVTLSYEFTLY